jgi:hypothetical protein
MKQRNNGVTFWDVRHLVKSTQSCAAEIEVDGTKQWVPARPLGWTDIPHRLRAVWMVWTGRADVVTWPGQ